MDLRTYFDKAKGHGVLATSDDQGRVNMAIFSRPHVFDDQTIAFIMPQRLTHSNLQSRPHAAYLFVEDGPGYKGKRLYLTKIKEEQDTELLHSLRRRTYPRTREARATFSGLLSSGQNSTADWDRRELNRFLIL
jgi:Pyridoxamine 5'-phosphate oxidase